MRVYEATVVDKCAGAEPVSYESHVAVGAPWELSFPEVQSKYLPRPYVDEDIHYYFTEDEFKPVNGEIETEEFKYSVGRRVA